MSPLEQAITEIVRREVQTALAAQGGFKRPAEFRIEARMSILELANASRVTPATIRRLESGRYCDARNQRESSLSLALVLGCDHREYFTAIQRQHAMNKTARGTKGGAQ